MTTTTKPDIIARPAFEPKDAPEYIEDKTHGDPRPVIIAKEVCPVCDGEGRFDYEVSGGRYNPHAQGGMWEPDIRERQCETCNGTGILTVRRCARCGHVDENDENGLVGLDETRGKVHWCDCEPEEVEAFMERMGDILWAARSNAALAQNIAGIGLSISPGVHGLTWNELHAVAAMKGVDITQHPPKSDSHGFASTLLRYHDRPIHLYGSWKEEK